MNSTKVSVAALGKENVMALLMVQVKCTRSQKIISSGNDSLKTASEIGPCLWEKQQHLSRMI